MYVVDSNDRERMEEAKYELAKILNEEQLVGVPLLVVANKQDLPHAMSISVQLSPFSFCLGSYREIGT